MNVSVVDGNGMVNADISTETFTISVTQLKAEE